MPLPHCLPADAAWVYFDGADFGDRESEYMVSPMLLLHRFHRRGWEGLANPGFVGG